MNQMKAKDYFERGLKFHLRGNYQQAKDEYGKCLKEDERFVLGHNNLGVIYVDEGKIDQGIKSFRRVVEIDPKYVGAWYNLGFLFRKIGDQKQARKHLEKVIQMDENNGQALSFLYEDYRGSCDWQRANEIGGKLEELTSFKLKSGGEVEELPLVNILRTDDLEQNFLVAKAMSEKIKRRIERVDFGKKGFRGKRITLGFISADFRSHPVAHQLVDIFGLFNRQKFKVIAYSVGADDQSEWRKRIENEVDEFEDISKVSYKMAAKKIVDDGVDILIDLMGFSSQGKFEIVAMRPAETQVSFIGYPGTTGGEMLDYVITDENLTPKNTQKYYGERFWYMPDGYTPSSKPRISKKSFRRADFGLADDDFVFCSFNSPTKIDKKVFDSWMKILRQSEGSVLWLWEKNDEVVERLLKEAEKRGIEGKRLKFSKSLPLDEHISRLKLANLALDTFGWSGGATTCQALWAGVPVLTMRGKHYLSRMSSSILMSAGMDELVVDRVNEYIKLAVRISKNRSELIKIKKKLDKMINKAPLFNTKKYVLNLEEAFWGMIANTEGKGTKNPA